MLTGPVPAPCPALLWASFPFRWFVWVVLVAALPSRSCLGIACKDGQTTAALGSANYAWWLCDCGSLMYPCRPSMARAVDLLLLHHLAISGASCDGVTLMMCDASVTSHVFRLAPCVPGTPQCLQLAEAFFVRVLRNQMLPLVW